MRKTLATVAAAAALTAGPVAAANAVVAGDLFDSKSISYSGVINPDISIKWSSAAGATGQDSGGKIYPVGYAASRVGFGWGLIGVVTIGAEQLEKIGYGW